MRRRGELKEPESQIAPLRGRDGWLFLTGDSNDVIAQHTGAWTPDRRWERRWTRQLRRRAREIDRLGAAYAYVVVPDKEAVYADLLPPEVEPAPRRPIDRLLELAERAGVPLVYPLAELIAGRKSGQTVFYPTDSHCTGHGGYLAYRAACAALGSRGMELDAVAEDEIEWVEETIEGDLGSRLDPPSSGRGARARLPGARARLVEDNRVYVTGRRVSTERAGGGPSAIVFGTSYAAYTLLFFAETFRRLVFVHTTAVDIETVRAERPDVVLSVTAERGIRRPPDDRRAYELLAEAVERKRRAGQVIDPIEGARQQRVSLLPPA